MKDQHRRPTNTPDYTDTDDDFFDLPPFEPHVETADTAPARRPLFPPGSRERSALMRSLLTLLVSLVLTVVVLVVAQASRLPDTPDTPAQPSAPSAPSTPSEPEEPQSPPAESYTYAADVSAYLDAINYTPRRSDILLLNKSHPCGESYVPAQLVSLNTANTLGGKAIQLDATAAAALEAMLLCMRADGITDTYVTSGYRDYAYQRYLFHYYTELEMTRNPSLSHEQATALVEQYSARPGYSEHQSGLCVDFMTVHMTELVNEQFEPTDAFRWLQQNAAAFGFILRYPESKTDVTGYSYESWHYRFVGKSVATEITTQGITLEEYLQQAAP